MRSAAIPGLQQLEIGFDQDQEVEVSVSVLYMSMSLDGNIAGPNDEPGNPGGDGFMRLHEWYGFASQPGPNAESIYPTGSGKQCLDEGKATGAVLSGRNNPAAVDHLVGDQP